MRNLVFLPRAMALHMVIASAAAVASSNSEELAICMPVRSDTIVWKLSRASSLQAVQACLSQNNCVSDRGMASVRSKSNETMAAV